MNPQDPTQRPHGTLILSLAAFSFSLFALSGKAVSPEIQVPQLILIRSLILVPALAIFARTQGHPLIGTQKKLLLLRGFLGSVGLFTFFYALKNLPLADTVLIFQAHPLVVAVFAPLLLKEKNSRLHWILLLVSFAGVALVVGPTGAGTWEGRASALVCCVLAGFIYILVRFLRRSERTLTIAFSFPAVSLVLFAPPFLFSIPGFTWVDPSSRDWLYLGLMALTAAAGQILLTLGLGRVPVARGSAISNLQVAFALIYGLIFFSEVPTWITLAGAILIVSSQIILAAVRSKTLGRCPSN